MIVYHFGKAIESVHALKGCPTLLRKIDRVKMKAALKTFEDSFPDFQYQRDAVAHSAEIQFDKRQYQKHVIRKHVELPNVKNLGEIKEMTVIGLLSDRTFIHSIRGDIVSIEISARTSKNLADIRDQYYCAFGLN